MDGDDHGMVTVATDPARDGRHHAVPLRSVAAEPADGEARQVARTILPLWKQRSGSFHSEHARPVEDLRPSPADMRPVLPREMVQTVVVAEVAVDSEGCAQGIHVLRPGRYPELLNLWLSRLRGARFVPKKATDYYQPETIVPTLRPEVW